MRFRALRVVSVCLVTACGREGFASPEDAATAMIDAARAGDRMRQLAAYSDADRLSEWAEITLDREYPREHVVHFKTDSIVRIPITSDNPHPFHLSRPDTVALFIYGTEPDWSVAPFDPTERVIAGYRPRKLADEMTPAEIAALPRTRTRYVAWAVRTSSGRWLAALEASRMGPLHVAVDSMRRSHCRAALFYTRACEGTARRIMRAVEDLRLTNRRMFITEAEPVVIAAGLLDSLSVEGVSAEPGFLRRETYVSYYVRNRSTRTLDAGVRVTDASGTLLSDDDVVLDVPPGGRARGITIEPEEFRPPYRVEIIGVGGFPESGP